MFEEASNRITAWLSKIKIISSDQEVVCKWGMTHILDTLFNIATFTAIGLLFRMLPETAVFTVTPTSGLDVNSYQETIKISSEATETAFDAYFQVLKGTVSLTKIQNPSDISGIANGTAKDAQKLQLPSVLIQRYFSQRPSQTRP